LSGNQAAVGNTRSAAKRGGWGPARIVRLEPDRVRNNPGGMRHSSKGILRKEPQGWQEGETKCSSQTSIGGKGKKRL